MKSSLKNGKNRISEFSINALTDEGVHKIHLATLDILKNTGLFVENEEALEVLHGGGCIVNGKSKVVKFPHHVVQDCIAWVPDTFRACGRRPEDDVILEDNRVTFTNFGEAIMFVDPYTGERRESTKADIEKTVRVIDYLEHVETYERVMCPGDKPPKVQALHNAEASLANTTKHHFLSPVNGYQGRKIVEMCMAIVGSREKLSERPLLTFNTNPVSPLKLVNDHCEIVMEAAKNKIGVNVVTQAMAGGTGPIHLAGTLVVHNCEVLSSLVLNQLTRKGSAFIYGSSTCPMDLRMATASVGSPETGMISAAVARLARYYSLPCFTAGG